MILLTIYKFVMLHQIAQSIQWAELSDYHLSTATSSSNLLCSSFTKTYQSPNTGTTRQMIFLINTEEGYSKIAYDFDLHLISASQQQQVSVIIKENGEIVFSNPLNFEIPNDICPSLSYEKKINFITEMTTQYSQIELSITISGYSYFIKNFKVFAHRCQSNCSECIYENFCAKCKPQFEILFKGKCSCPRQSPVFYQGQCISECPTGYYFKDKSCKIYTSKQSIFKETSLDQYEFIPDYNTTLRISSQTSMFNGKHIAGPFIQNEQIKYVVNYKSTVKFDLWIKLKLLLFNLSENSLLMKVNDFFILRIQHFYEQEYSQGKGLLASKDCVFQGYATCSEVYIEEVVPDILELSSITLFGNFYLHKKNQAWALESLSIDKIIPTPVTLTCSNFEFQGKCVDVCPPYSIAAGSVCESFSQAYKYSSFIAQEFNSSTSLFSTYITDVELTFYEQRFLLGGYGFWKQKQIKKYLGVSGPHYKLKLYVKILLIDFQQDDQMIIGFGDTSKQISRSSSGVACFNPTGSPFGSTSCVKREQIGTSLTDFFYILETEIDHTATTTFLSFNCLSSLLSYCAIYDLFLLKANCPPNCKICRSDTECLKAIGNFQQDCPLKTYYELGECQACSLGCASCSDKNTCLVCSEDYDLFGNQCYCKCSHYQQIPCLCDCLPNCLVCLSTNFYNNLYINCLSCDTANHKVQNGQLCECQDGYFIDDQKNCQQCYPTCMKCFSSKGCTACFTKQNRTLKDNLCQCSEGYYETDELLECFTCDSKCKECQYQSNFCTHCFPSQFRELQKNQCVCQKGYFENGNDICTKCNDLCELCSAIDTCLTCNFLQFRQLDQNKCICQIGFYDSGESICQACYYSCSQCNDSNSINQCTKCPQSRQQSSTKLQTFQCNCKQGYYDDGYLECSSCKTFINPPITHYCYSKCGDLIIQWDEDCDDGNQDPRDGCDICKLSDSLCLNSICQSCLFNQCVDCIDGYYLNSENLCLECSRVCKTCSDSSNNCIQCKHTFNNTCIDCQIQFGFFESQNQCYSICGDGIKTFEEDCDDGNSISGDGCSFNCKVEDYYICEQQCYKIPYVNLYLKEDHLDSIYSDVRNIQLSFSEQIKIDQNQSITSLITIKPLQKDLEFLSTEIKDLSEYNNDYNTIVVNLRFQLNQSAINSQAIVVIQNYTLIKNSRNFSLQKENYTITLLDYYQESSIVISATESSMELSQIILYISLGLAILAFIFGGIEIFWNLLDTLQLLSYLKYFNVPYPYNLQFYFTIFGFAEFDFLKQYFDLDAILQKYVETPHAAEKFYNEGYSTVFFVNIISVLIVFLTTFATFIAFHILYYLFGKITQKFSQEPIYEIREIGIIQFLFIRLARNLQIYFFDLKIQLRCALLRAFMTILYDLNLAIFLQLNDFSIDQPILFISSLCSLVCLAMQIIIVYFCFMKMNSPYYQLTQKVTELKYGALYEGLLLQGNKLRKYCNLFIMIKKGLTMAFLVTLYNYPCFQIALVSLLSLSNSIYIYFVRPLENQTEFYKQFFTEIILWGVQSLIFLYGYNEINASLNQQMITNLGWLLIGLQTAVILLQLILDIKQQVVFLQGKYKIVQYFIKQFNLIRRKLFSGDEDFTMESEQSDPSQNKIQSRNLISFQKRFQPVTKIRRLIAFTQNV